MATSLIVPVAYITVLVAALAIFSRVYRKRRAAEKRAYDPWFPSHPARDTYITLLSSPTPVPDNLLKSALLCRAQADVKRIWRLKDDKAALASLHQRGLVGDETMARFEAAEKELEAELVDVVQEANTFRQGWGQIIFATATEMAQAERTREVVLSIPKMRASEEKRLARRARFTAPLSTLTSAPSSSTVAASAGPNVSTSTSIPATPARSAGTAGSTNTPTSNPFSPSPVSAAASATAASPVPAATAASGSGSGSTSASASAAPSRAGSRSASPGPNEGLNVPSAGVGASPAGTPSKSTPNKKKKGKK